MRYQKTPLRFEINVYTPHLTLSVGRRDAAKRRRRMLRRTATASAANAFSRNLRLSDYVTRTRPRQKEAATRADDDATSKNTRENDHGNARQTNTHRFWRDSYAHPQITLGGIGRESGTARKGAGAARSQRAGNLDTK
jgi:hypothetical protein